jgi:hypothetical protein
LVVWDIFLFFHNIWYNPSQLTIFQRGWNHQPGYHRIGWWENLQENIAVSFTLSKPKQWRPINHRLIKKNDAKQSGLTKHILNALV